MKKNDMAEYTCWSALKQRCHNPKNPRYKDYGGRGIKVCARWRKSFDDFYADMGPRPSPDYSVDRINNDGDYEPSNCRWATWEEQTATRRRRQANWGVPGREGVRQMLVESPEMSGAEIARILGISRQRVQQIRKELALPPPKRRVRFWPVGDVMDRTGVDAFADGRELRIEDVRTLLQKRCDEAGGQRAFARAHGLTVQHVSSVLRGKNNAPVGRLCKALGIEPIGMRWAVKRK